MNRKNIRATIIQTTKDLMNQKPVFIDTETTGFRSDAEICDLAIVDHDGTILIDTLVKPTCHIPTDAQQIHGISNDDVKNAPSFIDILPQLADILDDRVVVMYNANFDLRMLRQSAHAHNQDLYCHLEIRRCDCAMITYAQFYGEPNKYTGGYKWQKLGTAAKQCDIVLPPDLHRARADAELTRQIVQYIAKQTA